jgi:UDP-N-acetylmuramyl pentapeptide synthase
LGSIPSTLTYEEQNKDNKAIFYTTKDTHPTHLGNLKATNEPQQLTQICTDEVSVSVHQIPEVFNILAAMALAHAQFRW